MSILLWIAGIYFGIGFLLGMVILGTFTLLIKRAEKGVSTYEEVQVLSEMTEQFAKPGITPTLFLVSMILVGFPLSVIVIMRMSKNR